MYTVRDTLRERERERRRKGKESGQRRSLFFLLLLPLPFFATASRDPFPLTIANKFARPRDHGPRTVAWSNRVFESAILPLGLGRNDKRCGIVKGGKKKIKNWKNFSSLLIMIVFERD